MTKLVELLFQYLTGRITHNEDIAMYGRSSQGGKLDPKDILVICSKIEGSKMFITLLEVNTSSGAYVICFVPVPKAYEYLQNLLVVMLNDF